MSDSGSLDMNDEYEAHALFALAFDCEECGKTLGFPEKEAQFSNSWYRWLANAAKEKHWFVPPADADGRMDVMTAWCPECADRLGLRAKK